MKSKIFASLLAILFLSESCTRSLDANTNTNSNFDASGAWRVSLFSDSGSNETNDFSGYSFSFNSNGTLAASKNGAVQNGTWGISSSSNKFSIDLGTKNDANKPLGKLTDDWKIISTSDTEIKLRDDNTTSNEFLTFTKN